MDASDLYGYVIRQANIVAHRADHYEDHPTYHTVAAIKRSAIEVHGMYVIALHFNNMINGKNACDAMHYMDKCVKELACRQVANRVIAKGRPRGYARK